MATFKTFDALATEKGRLFSFSLLYISEGIPFGFTSVALVTYLRGAGLALDQIGLFMAALFMPWAFKWAWAPLIDIFKLRRFGGRKTWISFCTFAMIITLLMTATTDYISDFQLLITMVTLNNVFCATQDVAIDALAVSTLKENERSRGNGFMFAGQYIGISLGGGGAMLFSSAYGFNNTLIFISALLSICLLYTLLFIKDPFTRELIKQSKTNVFRQLALKFKQFFVTLYESFFRSGKGPALGILFALMPVGAMALAYATLSTIQVDYGLSEAEIGRLSIFNTITAATGCALGGWLGDRFGLKPTLIVTYILTAIPTIFLAWNIYQFGLVNIDTNTFYSIVITHGLFYGMSFGIHAGIFMGMTNPLVAATQFTAFMAMTNLTISFANYWQGLVAENHGYAWVLFLDSLLILLPLMLIPLLRNRKIKSPKNDKQLEPAYSN
ncbi:MFS transporter [Thalassotalea crassostreae]|uniref:MFS transporter n=1 Tax=Thalassotalea crassostreae TaxID=1763536 RepID=UPI000837D5E9|nr:MFS transporter [Thalassotalea crassostreae]